MSCCGQRSSITANIWYNARMYRSSNSRVFTIILAVIVVIAVIVGLVALARNLFFTSSSNGTDEKTAQQVARENLLTLEADRSVRMTVRGPIVANEEFRTQQISIAPSSRTYTIYDGYLDSVLDEKTYGNNMAAYEEFVYALDKAAITTEGKYTEEEAGDIRGICATDRVYEYEFLKDGSVTEHYWTSTCKGSPGTFGASVKQVTNLFVKQIPIKSLDID